MLTIDLETPASAGRQWLPDGVFTVKTHGRTLSGQSPDCVLKCVREVMKFLGDERKHGGSKPPHPDRRWAGVPRRLPGPAWASLEKGRNECQN
jgi:hypothetical protein